MKKTIQRRTGKLSLLIIMALAVLLISGCGGSSGSSGSAGSGTAGPAPSDIKTAVFETHGGEEGSDTYSNTVTVEYADDVVYHVTDIMEEDFVTPEEYETRVEDYKSWEEAAADVEGYDCKIDIGDNELRSTITIDMNKAKVSDLSEVWLWWETDKDYLSYEEVRYHFVEESEFTVVEE